MRRANTCPRCGATVSQFAAGCAICGADLGVVRRRQRPRITEAFRIPVDARELAEGVALTLLMVIVALFAPLFGMALAALVFFDRRRRGQRTMRNMALVAFVLAVAALFVPALAVIP